MPSPAVPSASVPLTRRLDEVAAVLFATDPARRPVVLLGSTARGEARPDSDLDLLVILPQPTLTPVERQQVLWRLREALAPQDLRCGVDLVVVGQADAGRLAGSRWHVVGRALREGRDLHVCR